MPGVRTGASLDLAWLIATERIRRLYNEALLLVDARRASLSLPVDEFRESAIRALIASNQGDRSSARQFAAIALEAAGRTTSGLRYHKTVGLVGDKYNDVVEQIRRWAVD